MGKQIMPLSIVLTEKPQVVVIAEGKFKSYELEDYGEFEVKTSQGKITQIKKVISDKF